MKQLLLGTALLVALPQAAFAQDRDHHGEGGQHGSAGGGHGPGGGAPHQPPAAPPPQAHQHGGPPPAMAPQQHTQQVGAERAHDWNRGGDHQRPQAQGQPQPDHHRPEAWQGDRHDDRQRGTDWHGDRSRGESGRAVEQHRDYAQSTYRIGGGRPEGFQRYHGPAFRYPQGYGYRRWQTGLFLPSIFLTSAYFWDDWDALGVGAPPYGDRWVRYGPDLLLVNIRTGRVDDAIYDAFY